MLATGGSDIAEAFSTDLYTGNGGTQTITNGIDLSGEGGLTWIKSRSAATDHQLFDTERGATKELISNSTAAEATDADTLTAFNSDGFSIGADSSVNTSAATYVSWTFRKAPKFFDVVTYTGDGVAGRTVAHNLGSVPGMIIVKRTSGVASWRVYHRGIDASAPEDYWLQLNQTSSRTGPSANIWDSTAPTINNFYVAVSDTINGSGEAYVAYIFAHDTDDGSMVQCGSYTGNGSATGPVVTLGWEPQWLLVKQATASGAWVVHDNKRNTANPRNSYLLPNDSQAEVTSANLAVDFNSTGFQLKGGGFAINQSGGTYIYMAIRKEGA
jgi:hypothetical protein